MKEVVSFDLIWSLKTYKASQNRGKNNERGPRSLNPIPKYTASSYL